MSVLDSRVGDRPVDTLDGSKLGVTNADRALARSVSAAWARLAITITGDPNGEGLPGWPACTLENDAHLELGDSVKAGAGLRKAECDVLDAVSAAARRGAAKKRWR